MRILARNYVVARDGRGDRLGLQRDPITLTFNQQSIHTHTYEAICIGNDHRRGGGGGAGGGAFFPGVVDTGDRVARADGHHHGHFAEHLGRESAAQFFARVCERQHGRQQRL